MKDIEFKKKNIKPSVIFYELNEIPPKILEYYVKEFPNSNFAKLLDNAAFFETKLDYKGHLHPWSVWPSVHRGVSIKKHKLKFINQNKSKSKKYPPLWEIISNSNKNVGIHGSLQSYPPLINSNTKFFLPDTFAPDSKAFPKELSYLQEFNLSIIDLSKGLKKLSIKKLAYLLINILISNQLKFKTILILFSHLIKEKIYKKYISRRSIYQSTLTFDSYFEFLQRYKPVFSSYFTNHLAGMMHRYWKDLFPESFKDLEYIPSKFNKYSIIQAMKESDKQIGKLLGYAKKNNSDLLIISGMGQTARERGVYLGELQFHDFQKLKKIIYGNFNNYCEILPAMLPDICIKFEDKVKLEIFLNQIKLITDTNFKPIFKIPYKPELNTLNISLKLTKTLYENKKIIISKNQYNIEDIGLRIIFRDPGTAYHINKGSLIWYSNKNKKRYKKLFKLANTNYHPDITEIAPSICKLLNVEVPDYMNSNSPLVNCI